MARFLWVGVVAASVFLMVMLFSPEKSLLQMISSLLLFVNALVLLVFVFLEKDWQDGEWLVCCISIFLIVAVMDKLVVDIYVNFLDIFYLLLLAVAFLLLLPEQIRTGVLMRPVAESVAAGKKVREIAQSRTGMRAPRMQALRPTRIIPSKERKKFIRKNFARKDVAVQKDVQGQKEVTVQAVAQEGARHEFPSFPHSLFSFVPSLEEEKGQRMMQDLPAREEISVSLPVQPLPSFPLEEPESLVTDIFIASTNGQRFHLPTCMIAKRIPQVKKVVFTNPVEVVREGFNPCGVCNPLKRG